MAKKIDLLLITLLLISLVPLIPLLHWGMFDGHDSISHVARLVTFYQSLSEGNIVPRWAANLNFGYGHPVLMFLYPMSNYIGSFWHLLGFTYIDSVKLTFGVTYILSGIFMYLFISDLFGRKAGFLAGILYIFSPYRFVDLYVRSALGEHIAFTFMPLILFTFNRLIKSQNYLYIIPSSVSLAFLILSHNAVSLMFIPFLLIFLIVRILLSGVKIITLQYILCSFILGFMVSAFFWVPALFEGKYTLRDILTVNEYQQRFPAFFSLLYSPWSYGGSGHLSKEVGFVAWILVFWGIVYLFNNKTHRDKNIFWLVAISEIFFWITVLLMNKISIPLWKVISIMQKFQFPWRYLTLTVLLTSLLPVLVKKKFVIVLLVFLSIIPTISYWQPKGFLKENDNYFISIYSGTTDTGESSPIWSVRGMEQSPKAKIELIGGEGIIKELKRNTTNHILEVNAKTDVQILDNTVYFPGWRVISNNKEVPIEYQDQNHRGLITFRLPQGKQQVVIEFIETKLRSVSNYISLFSIVVLFGILGLYVISRSRHH